VVVVSVLVALAILLTVTGLQLAHVNGDFRSACASAGDCTTATNPVVYLYRPLQFALPFLAMIAPALIGMFLGAPLIARELDTGTFRLAWTQSITQRRWLATKLGLVGLMAMLTGGLLTWMITWWARPLDAISQDRFDPMSFGYHGIVPIGYAAFAFALGAATGALLRRPVPAMAVTLVVFVAARLAVMYWVRPYFATPLQASHPLADARPGGFSLSQPRGGGLVTIGIQPPEVNLPDAWVYNAHLADNAGNPPTQQTVDQACHTLVQAAQQGQLQKDDFQTCIDKLSATYHTVVTYQPASRFWPFQWAETGTFFAAALALAGLTYWWLRRHHAC
jgi:hypothetical protein